MGRLPPQILEGTVPPVPLSLRPWDNVGGINYSAWVSIDYSLFVWIITESV